jgi:glycosyltransferase involved in cell wall biosynthesis
LIKIESNLHYLIVGPVTNETYFEAIQDYVRVHSIEKYVTIIPGLPAGGTDLVDAFHASDLFVLPSIHEPFGIVILEAWASGIPVLAARVGGIPAFVDNCVDGLLFTANNMDEFVHAFKEVVFNVDAGKKLGEAGRLKADSEYSWDSITSRLVSTYEEAVRENPLRK